MSIHPTAVQHSPQPSPVAADPACSGCADDQRARLLSRRGLLSGGLAAGAAIAISEHLTVRYANAASPVRADAMVVLFLRGGFDGLSAVVPVTDPDYYSARPTIAIPRESTLQLNTQFGLHPALAPLKPLWDNRSLGFVHAAGLTSPNRSHFSAMEDIERAAPGSSIRNGWLDRTLGLSSTAVSTNGPFRGTSIGYRAPRSMTGTQNELTIPSIKDFTLAGGEDPSGRVRWTTALGQLHSTATAPVGDPARSVLSALDATATLSAANYAPSGGANYPDSPLGEALQDAAQLLKSPHPIAVLTIDEGDWDMHTDLGTVERGWMRDKLTDLADALAAFASDLGDGLANVTLITMSEFGRRTEENASHGVDHGWGNVMFLLGGGVAGGAVHGTWPGLSPTNLYQGDVRVTTDYRAVLADVLQHRCGATVEQTKSIFPNWSGTPLRVSTTR